MIPLVEAELQSCFSSDGDEGAVDQMSINVAIDSESQRAGQKCQFSALAGMHNDHEGSCFCPSVFSSVLLFLYSSVRCAITFC